MIGTINAADKAAFDLLRELSETARGESKLGQKPTHLASLSGSGRESRANREGRLIKTGI